MSWFYVLTDETDVCGITQKIVSTPGKLKICLTTVGIEPTSYAERYSKDGRFDSNSYQ